MLITALRRMMMPVTKAMRELNLREYQRGGPFSLSISERDGLRDALPSVAIEPAPGTEARYYLTPGATVGAVNTGGLSALIQPKIGIPKLLSLACYAMGKVKFYRDDFDFPDEYALPDALALVLAAQARRAFVGGLLHGYRTEEETLSTVRGRIRFEEQLRRRFGASFPVEARYDEFTADILANRLVKAAAQRLGGMRLRCPAARRGLGWIAGMLDGVSLVEFQPRNIPAVAFDRLNEHYRRVVELSRLILRHSAFESGRGIVRASGLLLNMNEVFQEFVTQALREALGASAHRLKSDRDSGGFTLDCLGDYAGDGAGDGAGRVKLRPDLIWREGLSCRFVGDVKYKNAAGGRIPNADLYQMLAYATALDLPGGLLIYAEGEATPAAYRVRHCGKRLEVAALNLAGTLDDTLAGVREIAGKVTALCDEARGIRSSVGVAA